MLSKKTLFIAPFKDTSGYASAARNYARALIQLGQQNLILRSVRYDSGNKSKLLPELQVLHNLDCNGAETIIQMLTPNEMRPVEGKRNIAICCWETDCIPQHWVNNLNKFDLIIVPCQANYDAFKNSGVTTMLHIVPFTFFEADYNIAGLDKFQFPFPTEGLTIYYNISQWSHKKGIDTLIRGYLGAFQNGENVMLALKGYINMKNQNGDLQKMANEVNQIKQAMRLKNYPPIYIIDAMMTDIDVLRLHKTCNVYVNTSRGEGWGVPAFESLLLGNELLSVNHTGMEMYLTDDFYYPISSTIEPVFNMPHPDSELYTSKENWMEPSTYATQIAFRASYNTLVKKNNKEVRAKLFDSVQPTKIGQKLVEIING